MNSHKKKVGNPQITVRLDPELKAQLDAHAKNRGLGLATLMRMLAVEDMNKSNVNLQKNTETLEK